MKLAVISPESHDPREIAVVRALFAAGLDRYHVRKPLWSAAELETYLACFSPAERARMVLHSHHVLAASWALGGIHHRDEEAVVGTENTTLATPLRTRACHDLGCLRSALGRYDAVLLSPIFASISKSGYAPDGRIDFAELKGLLARRTPEQRRTAVFALGGIDTSTTPKCAELGFDGVAVLGAVWNADDPIAAFRQLQESSEAGRSVSYASVGPKPTANGTASVATPAAGLLRALARIPIMCLTQDGLPFSHVDQARRLCQAGARWIQLRVKDAPLARWLEIARAMRKICDDHGAVFIVNDSVEIALQSNADGVHLGRTDLGWTEARRLLGPDRIVGGTVNDAVDAMRARTSGCLNYAGVGPWRYTANKKNLSPILGPFGMREITTELGNLPAWAIGGIEAEDVPAIRALGIAGLAISSALYRGGKIEQNYRAFASAWDGPGGDLPAPEISSGLEQRGGHEGRPSRSAPKPVTTL